MTQILRHEKLSHRQRLKESVCVFVCVLTQMVKDVSLRERREREREREERRVCVCVRESKRERKRERESVCVLCRNQVMQEHCANQRI